MNPYIRLAIGVGAVGGAAGGAVFLNKLSSETIEKKLLANNYEILKDENSEEWEKILKSYTETVTENASFKFDDFAGTKTPPPKPKNTEDIKILQEKCKEALNLLSTSNDSYKKAEKWCTVPQKLTKVLENKGYAVLETKDEGKTNENEWNEKIKAYNEAKAKEGDKFKAIITENEGKFKEGSEGRKAITTACKKVLDSFHYDKNYETNLEKSEKWCANKKDSSK